MDKVTQQNAASAEESSSAASELNGQAEELAAMVGSFQLARRQAGGAMKRPAAHASGARQAPRRPDVGRTLGAGTPIASRSPPVDAFPMDAETEARDF
jgi:methyl-accepting chemotaxis protein